MRDHGTRGTAPLDGLLAALAAGEALTASLAELHEALLAAGDAAGVDGRTRGLDPVKLGLDPSTPDEYVLLCPTGHCARHAWPDSPQTPHCRISGQPLRRERL
ncbi:hypothetical protein [Streptomyces sp. NRRL B-3648]|uniref:hypothetical protein n=1 Tax=Streptomyces sp. NRRL B-3648 TaxID=1519493 RepID=UPI00131B3FC9|nr:hypothetical protein [Streptomyces sp. NRRL B-3648]